MRKFALVAEDRKTLQARYEDDDALREAFETTFAMSMLLRRALWSENWQPPDPLVDAISLTKPGEEWSARLQSTAGLGERDARVSLFLAYYYDELYVDSLACDGEAIVEATAEEIRRQRLRLPWIYDRLLHDRYVDAHVGYVPKLSSKETTDLLQETPQGVFQLGRFVIGPLGILLSSQHRLLPPSRFGPAVPCTDPGCMGIHDVELTSYPHPARQGADEVDKTESIAGTGLSGYRGLFESLCGAEERYMDDLNPAMLPLLIANAFGERELSGILGETVNSHPAVRQTLPDTAEFRELMKGAGEQIAARLDRAASFQMSLLAPDEALVSAIEHQVDTGAISLPTNEVRTVMLDRETVDAGWYRVAAELSVNGVRFVPSRGPVSVLRLVRLVDAVYTGSRGQTELNWTLRHSTGSTATERLRAFARHHDPAEVLRQLVFTSEERLRTAFERLRYGRFQVPVGPEAEEHLINRMVWKLGFSAQTRPDLLPLFWSRLTTLSEVADTSQSPYGEREKEQIRSAAVNLFVSLEDVLDHSLSFVTWALLADHYGKGSLSRFVFNVEDARAAMVESLGGKRVSDDLVLELDARGRNTLAPLIQGFRSLAEHCRDLVRGNPSSYEIDEASIPGWSVSGGLFEFPFRHRCALFDLDPASVDVIFEALQSAPQEFDRVRAADVRNRLEHKRQDFPGPEEIGATCNGLREIVSRLEALGICPSVHLFDSEHVDRHERVVSTLRDYRGEEVLIYSPNELALVGYPLARTPQLVFRAAKLADSSEVLRFRYQEESDFARFWRGYPPRSASEDEGLGGRGPVQSVPVSPSNPHEEASGAAEGDAEP
jgi:hypothetical protein